MTTPRKLAENAAIYFEEEGDEEFIVNMEKDIAQAITEAIEAEREECAKVAEGYRIRETGPSKSRAIIHNICAEEVATAIRARGEK